MSAIPQHPSGTDAAAAGTRRWTFGAVSFDERSFELQVNGQPVELERKPLEVLLYLLQHAGEVVTKEELLEAVWPKRIVSDNSLPKALSRIREVIGDEDQSAIKTVHGYGYRLVAPVTVELKAATTPRLGLAAGDHPPLRPLWSLVQRLGGGGQGEVWLVKHDKMHEQRVFKFALDLAGLAAIKREITLYRVLRDSLGARADLANVLDWNLEEAPYFIELEYAAGGNLEAWARDQGGLGQVPLEARLEIIAKIADALAAAHSVGVLHKDLKPSNVLIAGTGTPTVKLTDFGSGGVLDPQKLDAMGITRLGFTKSVMHDAAAASALYVAPEVLVGQPATVQADVYALGVMLFQIIAGDFRLPLSPGWEAQVPDPLLREDIAAAVDGDRSRRLSEALQIATRLRTLDQRRDQRAAEQMEKARLEREQEAANERAHIAELALVRLRTRRNWMLTALSVLIVGVALSLGLYFDARRARNEAAKAAASSQAVADFLSKDLFTVVGSRPLRELTVPELLDAASGNLSQRLQEMPAAAAQIHNALGNAFFTMESFEQAERELDHALAYYEKPGADFGTAVQATSQLLLVKTMTGKLSSELGHYENNLIRGLRDLPPGDPRVRQLRQALAHVRLAWLGDWHGAEVAFKEIAQEAVAANPADDKAAGDALALAGQAVYYLGRPTEAAELEHQAKEHLGKLTGQSPLMSLARSMELDVRALGYEGRFDEAEAELVAERKLIDSWVPNAQSAHLLSLELARGILRIQEGRAREAVAILEQVVKGIEEAAWNKHLDATLEPRTWLARAYRGSGKLDRAEATLRRALETRGLAPTHPLYQAARIELADVLVAKGNAQGAREVLAAIDRKVLDALGSEHPWVLALDRLDRLLTSQPRG